MKSLPIVLVLIAATIFSACKNTGSGSTGPTETGVIVPLSVYNIWVFDHVDYNPDGSIKKEFTDSVQVYPDTKINPSNGITALDLNGQYVANLVAGFYIIGANIILPELWLKYPANVGDRFRDGPETMQLHFPTVQKPDSIVNLTSVYTVAAKNLSVTVPAGSFYCYKYETDFQDPVYHVTYYQVLEYYSPNVGEIMREEYARDQSNTMKLASRQKLISKKLQP